MSWGPKKKVQMPQRSVTDFFKKGSELIHTQGLKMLVWGDAEAGKVCTFS